MKKLNFYSCKQLFKNLSYTLSEFNLNFTEIRPDFTKVSPLGTWVFTWFVLYFDRKRNECVKIG